MKKVVLCLLPKVFPQWDAHNPAVPLSAGERFKVKKSLLLQGDESLYGDNSVAHYRLETQAYYDESKVRALLPYNRFFQYDGKWNYDGDHDECFIYDSATNAAFGFTTYLYKWDKWEHGIREPAGTVRWIGQAFRVFEENGDIFFQYSSGCDPSVAGKPYPDPSLGYQIWPRELSGPDKGWLWESELYKLYDYQTDRLLPVLGASFIQTDAAITQPFIPYYWVDWILANKPKPTTSDHAALSECFRNTVTEYTSTGMNNLENLSETISLIRDIRNGNIEHLFQGLADWAKDSKSVRNAGLAFINGKWTYQGNVLKDASKLSASFLRRVVPDMWLKYRYLYNTTKMDAEAAVDYALHKKYAALDGNQVLRGSIGISTGQIHIKMRLTQKHNLALSIRNMLSGQGLFPDSHTLWDMVPFSFVVDWFLPEGGEALEDWDQRYLSELYSVDELLVSRKEEWNIEDFNTTYLCKSYVREFMDECPQFEVYQDPDHSTSSKTILKRIADGASLVISLFD